MRAFSTRWQALRGRANRRATFRTWQLSEGLHSLLTTPLTHMLLAYWRKLLVSYKGPRDFLWVAVGGRPAKSPLVKTGVVLTATFEQKLREGSQQTYYCGRKGV